jgi:hypothetical protein
LSWCFLFLVLLWVTPEKKCPSKKDSHNKEDPKPSPLLALNAIVFHFHITFLLGENPSWLSGGEPRLSHRKGVDFQGDREP